MGSKRRTDEGYGKGSESLGTDEIRDAYSILGGAVGKRSILDQSPLFAGISGDAKRVFGEALRNGRRTINKGERLTVHSSEQGGSPRNKLWLEDRDLLSIRLKALAESTEDDGEGILTDDTVDMQLCGLRSWLGGVTNLTTAPGLVAESAKKQTARTLPPLVDFYKSGSAVISTADVRKLMINIGGIFSDLLVMDNRGDTPKTENFRPHQVPTLLPGTAHSLTSLPGVNTRALGLGLYAPDRGPRLTTPHLLLLSGKGWFFDRRDVGTQLSSTGQQLMEGGIKPIAELDGAALAFQWAGIKPGVEAQALFAPGEASTTLTALPIQDDLFRLHMAVDSMAGLAASMHTHVANETARLEAEKPALQRLWNVLGRKMGILS